jgi:putative tryptophan/tyrosine transport system substrate-binding protein
VRVHHAARAGIAARYPDYAAELAGLAPAVVLAATTAAVIAMRGVAPAVPVVFVQAIDPVGSGLVASLARPGGNATGFTVYEYAIAANGWSCSRRSPPASPGRLSYGTPRSRPV